jgi:hypothetical protein
MICDDRGSGVNRENLLVVDRPGTDRVEQIWGCPREAKSVRPRGSPGHRMSRRAVGLALFRRRPPNRTPTTRTAIRALRTEICPTRSVGAFIPPLGVQSNRGEAISSVGETPAW